MPLDELRLLAAELFPFAVTNVVDHSGEPNPELEQIKQLCWQYYKPLGFQCMGSCFEAVMPRREGELTLSAWSSKEMNMLPWAFRVSCRPFFLFSYSAHFEINHDGPLPSVTETGYRSVFAPMSFFSRISPEQFIRVEVGKDLPQSYQLELF